MTKITTREFYAASRERLASLTSDEALLAAFDLQAEYDLAGDSHSDDRKLVQRWDTAMGDFLGEMMHFRLSLDYVFGGKGKPFMPPLPDLESCEFARDFERLPEGVKPVVATFIEGLADYERRKKIADYKPKLDDRA